MNEIDPWLEISAIAHAAPRIFPLASVIIPISVAIATVLVSPFIVLARVASALGINTTFITFGSLLSLIPGRIGACFRTGYYLGTIEKIAPDVILGFGTFCSKRSAEIGRGTYVGAYCIIGGATIGEKVLVASRVSITSGRHQHGSGGRGVDHATASAFKQLRIGDRSWIGEGSIVMADVGSDCIVGAGSVVVNPVPDGSVVAGNPAKPLRSRNQDLQQGPALPV